MQPASAAASGISRGAASALARAFGVGAADEPRAAPPRPAQPAPSAAIADEKSLPGSASAASENEGVYALLLAIALVCETMGPTCLFITLASVVASLAPIPSLPAMSSVSEVAGAMQQASRRRRGVGPPHSILVHHAPCTSS